MVNKMTTWTLNAVFIAIAATAAFLPKPDEIRKALEYGREQSQIALAAAAPPEPQTVISYGPARGISDVASLTPASNCMDGLSSKDPDAIRACLPEVIDQINRFDQFAAAQVSVGIEVHPIPEIETMRLSLVQLCRNEWGAVQRTDTRITQDGCSSVMQGIAY